MFNTTIKTLLLFIAVFFSMGWMHVGFYIYGLVLIGVTFLFIWTKEKNDEN